MVNSTKENSFKRYTKMAKRKTQAETVKILEVEPSPCELANKELRELGYRLEMHPDNFKELAEAMAYTPKNGDTKEIAIPALLRLNELSGELLHLKYNESGLKTLCLGCNSYKNYYEKLQTSLKPILDVCLKYAPKD